MALLHALACLIISVHHRIVVQNVSSIQIVPEIKLVFARNAKILVQDPVELTVSVLYTIMFLFVHVWKDIQETLSIVVNSNQ